MALCARSFAESNDKSEYSNASAESHVDVGLISAGEVLTNESENDSEAM